MPDVLRLSLMDREKHTLQSIVVHRPKGIEMRELCYNEWPVQKLSKKKLADRPKSESDSGFFGGPKFSELESWPVSSQQC